MTVLLQLVKYFSPHTSWNNSSELTTRPRLAASTQRMANSVGVRGRGFSFNVHSWVSLFKTKPAKAISFSSRQGSAELYWVNRLSCASHGQQALKAEKVLSRNHPPPGSNR